MTEPSCTCGKRPKHKCCKESGAGGKMCLKEDTTTQDFINSQEELDYEFEKIIADNLSDLYLE